jgi:hypothetical protein
MSEMTIERAAEVLKAYNAWRRGDAEASYVDSKPIGIAIDVAVRELERITKTSSKECNKNSKNESQDSIAAK